MIGRIALRIATISALKGRTLVGDKVLDSEMVALDHDENGKLFTRQKRPFITVYTGDAEVDGDLSVRSLHKSGITELIIEIAVASTLSVRNDKGNQEVVAGIPATDENFEFFLDVTARQVINALSDPNNEWSEIWRNLTNRVVAIVRRRTSSALGERFAAMQIVILVDLLPDPLSGAALAPTGIWAKLFARLGEPTVENPDHDPDDPDSPPMVVDPEVAAKLIVLQSLLGEAGQSTELDEARRRFGLTRGEAEAMLLSLQPGADNSEVIGGTMEISP